MDNIKDTVLAGQDPVYPTQTAPENHRLMDGDKHPVLSRQGMMAQVLSCAI